jgi:hypothetical protein
VALLVVVSSRCSREYVPVLLLVETVEVVGHHGRDGARIVVVVVVRVNLAHAVVRAATEREQRAAAVAALSQRVARAHDQALDRVVLCKDVLERGPCRHGQQASSARSRLAVERPRPAKERT